MEKPKSRKPHKKSRNGCLPCKARHVKCDESKPECVNCDKYGMKCEYPPPKKRISPNDHISPSVFASTPSSTEDTTIVTLAPHPATNESSEVNLGAESVQHLRLMHHFLLSTSRTISLDASAQELIQSHLVGIAFDYPFLLNAILALAALHLSRLDENSRANYLHQAERYHDAAIALFRTGIQEIDDTNFEAVLFFAAILDPYSSAIPMSANDPDHGLDSILSNFALTRRLRPMVSQLYPKFLASELSRLTPPDTQGIDWTTEPPETELTTLRKFADVIQHLYPPDIIEAYSHAIRILDIVFAQAANLSPNLPSAALVKMFVHQVQPRFFELLSERQPGALIIFAHYGVLLKRIQHYWFLEGYAEQVLRIADTFLPGEWKAWLDWPREQINAGREAS